MRQCQSGRQIRDSVTNCVMQSEQDESFIERRWLKGEQVLEEKGKRREGKGSEALYMEVNIRKSLECRNA